MAPSSHHPVAGPAKLYLDLRLLVVDRLPRHRHLPLLDRFSSSFLLFDEYRLREESCLRSDLW
jgi:hypothetical protein